MIKYKIKICIPNKHNKWSADIKTKTIECENFNYMLMNAFTEDEFKSGSRIISIEKLIVLDDRLYWEVIK